MTCAACARTSPAPTISPVAGSRGICPEQKTKPEARSPEASSMTIPCEYGPMALGAWSVATARRSLMPRTIPCELDFVPLRLGHDPGDGHRRVDRRELPPEVVDEHGRVEHEVPLVEDD